MVEKARILMNNCKITITTAVDGQETTVVREGVLSLDLSLISLAYREENAEIFLCFRGEQASIERKGDYGLRLVLKEGEQSEGEIGIGGSNGKMMTYTHRVAYSVTKNSLLASLKYDLLFGDEKQEMRLRIMARMNEERGYE